MDLRTTMRELDEVIVRAQQVTERENALLNVLPDCGLRRRKQHQVRAMRAHVDRLRRLRRGVTRRRLASGFN